MQNQIYDRGSLCQDADALFKRPRFSFRAETFLVVVDGQRAHVGSRDIYTDNSGSFGFVDARSL